MHPSPAPRPPLRLTRRGRLVRSGLVLLLAVLVILAVVSLVRALGRDTEPGTGAASPQAPASSGATGTADAAGASPGAPGSSAETATPEAETPAEPAEERSEGPEQEPAEEMVRSGTVGDGTWTFAPAQAAMPSPGTVRTYAVRVEGGIDLTAEEVSEEIARILADARGWQELEAVAFQQVATPEEAEFTISVASPPTVDELCLPAKTGGTWSCRIGAEVALNSDRWLHATPTYDDLAEYRAYMVNHEVGHFLGHGHADCGGAGRAAPVMLQQSMDLHGCTPNAWPATAATG